MARPSSTATAEEQNSVHDHYKKMNSAYRPNLFLRLARDTKQLQHRSRYYYLPVIGIHPRVDSRVLENPHIPNALQRLQTMSILESRR